MNKSKILIISLSLIFTLTFVSAIPYIDLGQGSQNVIEIIQDFFSPIASALFGSGEFLFEKILFLVLLVAVINIVLNRFTLFEDHTQVTWIVTIIVSILATRFLTETQVVNNIILPYTVLGVALTSLIPLIIIFFFLQSFENNTLRKVGWLFFLVVFVGIWLSRYDQLGNLSWVYFATGVFTLFFFIFDGSIRRALINQQMEQLGMTQRSQLERKIRNDIRDVERDLSNNIITPSQHRKIKKSLQKKLKALMKN